MPGTGSGSRRSHTKSRKGCRTCKRRHIRCDENFPQCRNCTKHNVRCDYMDAPADGENPPIPGSPDLNISSQDQQELDNWVVKGEWPFPSLGLNNEPSPSSYSPTDLRLIHHISSVAVKMQESKPEKDQLWTKRVPIDFVMHSLLALSASHLSWLTACSATMHLAYQHRGLALKGLQKAIGSFCKENSDAVLAASILLSWQATDWRTWASLMQGTSTVIDEMQEWKGESQLSDFIEEKQIFGRTPYRPQIVNSERDRQVLNHIFNSLERLQPYVSGKIEEERGLNELINFIQNLKNYIPIQSPEEQFEHIYPLRSWLFFLPIDFVKRVERDPDVMILLAHFYGVALAVEPLFPAVGAAYFGAMSIGPIEEIHKTLLRLNSEGVEGKVLEWPISLMDFPLEMVHEFKLRMGWRTIEEINSPVESEHASEMMDYEHGFGNQGVFTYLVENLGVKNVQFEEMISLDAYSLKQQSPVYGVIFLFKYPVGEKKTDEAVDGQYDFEASENIFFANQTIQNACATQAILSVLLNRGDLQVGDSLRDFREFTQAFPAELRGEALSNSELIRDVHNSFARSSPFIDEGTRAATEDDDVYHFIAYTPVNGVLYELDGLQPSPISHGSCSDSEFCDKIIPVLQRRINRYPATEIRFNLLAMIQDPRIRASEIGDVETVTREDDKRKMWTWENELRRHNFVGFTHEVLKNVVASNLKEGKYDEWLNGAKEKAKQRMEERIKKGKKGEDIDE
ncbi:putative ubiquitin carboxyl-terminal hydrolase 2 [Morchella conica CCBAS932]|uniref:ubiquitinyl hydrolase 1 n=1 Tax=Morchella conica CCBAS932 TaxID=1392247 RepID=A0A3N4KXV5_9PEZI|nr:putative ubiquitin carboxyl-terminal hydrolase 2 [Morchella conica CCBAS932]